jgi:hypothetical protein
MEKKCQFSGFPRCCGKEASYRFPHTILMKRKGVIEKEGEEERRNHRSG